MSFLRLSFLEGSHGSPYMGHPPMALNPWLRRLGLWIHSLGLGSGVLDLLDPRHEEWRRESL